MGWRESEVSQERIKFVVMASRGERSMAALCREFGISRQTGHTWLKRFRESGVSGVVEGSRKPVRSPSRIGQATVDTVMALRRRWPDWGAWKLHQKLRELHPELP